MVLTPEHTAFFPAEMLKLPPRLKLKLRPAQELPMGCSYIPTADSFSILERFRSMDEWTYRSSVTRTLECPRISLRDFISNPTSTHRVAKVCRRI